MTVEHMKTTSNCLLGALAIRKRLGGTMEWRPGWHRDGFWGFIGSPWGHWSVTLADGTRLSYSTHRNDLQWWQQLKFRGYIKKTRS